MDYFPFSHNGVLEARRIRGIARDVELVGFGCLRAPPPLIHLVCFNENGKKIYILQFECQIEFIFTVAVLYHQNKIK